MPTTCPLCNLDRASPLFEKQGYTLVRCANCELVWVANPPSTDAIIKLYSFESGYHKVVDTHPTTSPVSNRAFNEYRSISHLRTPGRLLDIGCSSGAFLSVAQANGWAVTGIELSADTARLAREQKGLDVRVGTVFDQEFEEASLDVITLWDVIEHMPQPGAALERIRHWLKDDGMVVLETPNIGGLFPRVSYRFARMLNYWPHPEPPGHLFQFSKSTMERLLNKAGYSVMSITDHRIPLAYSFGTIRTLLGLPKRLAYAMAFAPLAAIGPWVGAGDTIRVIARKSKAT